MRGLTVAQSVRAMSRGHTHARASLSQEQDKALTHATMWRNLEDTVLSKRSRHTKPHACVSYDKKCPEQANPETGSELVGAKSWEGMRLPFGVMECSGIRSGGCPYL
jgi:hypothetical protein